MIHRILMVSTLCCLTAACQAPPPVRNMSGLLAKFSGQMDNSVSAYVAALNESNAKDNPLLQTIVSDANRTAVANANEIAIWKLADGPKAANVARTLTMVSSMQVDDSNPVTGTGLLTGPSTSPSTPRIAFDNTPLKTIGTVAGNIATPQSRMEQLKLFAAFAQQVKSDLKTTTDKTAEQ